MRILTLGILCNWTASMGVGKIFSRGAVVDFPKKCSKGGQKWWNVVFTLEIEKTTFFANNFEIQGGQGPPTPPSDAHDCQ